MPGKGWIARIEGWSPRRVRVALVASVGVVMAGMISHGHHALSGDALHYMIAARSVAFDRDLDLANDYGDPARILQAPADDHARPGRDGRLRPAHDIGWSVLMAPVVALCERIAVWSDRLPESFRPAAHLVALFGEPLARSLPTWESLTGSVIARSAATLLAWATLTPARLHTTNATAPRSPGT